MKKIFFFLIILILLYNLKILNVKGSERLIGLYGFDKNAEIFKGLSIQEISDYLSKVGINAVWGDFDEKGIPDVLHNKGIKTFFEISIFSSEKLWKEFPDSRPVLSSGKLLEKEGWYAGVCPANEKVRKKKLKEIDETLARGFYDGVWLDFIRYPCHWEVKEPKIFETCFCDNCLNKFQKDTGIKIPYNNNDKKKIANLILSNYDNLWREWKCEQITNFCAEVKKLINEKYQGKILGMFGVPWRMEDFNGAIKEIICQDYKNLAKYIDVFSPMSYHLMCNRDIKWIDDVTKEIVSLTNKPVWVIIQGVSDPVKMTDEEFEKAIKEGLSNNSSGIIVYSFRHMVEEKKWEVFINTVKYLEK